MKLFVLFVERKFILSVNLRKFVNFGLGFGYFSLVYKWGNEEGVKFILLEYGFNVKILKGINLYFEK